MSGDLIIDLRQLLPLRRRLMLLSNLRLQRLFDVLGGELENQTRRRISTEKTDPDGEPWDEWSEAYAAVRPQKGGLLDLDGGLVDSIAYETSSDAITVGSNLVYALVHQDGWKKKNIPARPYLGVSDENLADLGQLVIDFIAQEVRAA